MTTRPRPSYHHGSLETALLQEAVDQVRSVGAEQVSLRGLAQAVGVSPSAAYQHFPDKAALLTAVGQWAFGELARRMRRQQDAVTADGDTGAIGRFAAIGQGYVEFATTEPHLFRHMFSALLVQQACPTPDETSLGDDAHNLLVRALEELGERGLLREGVGTDSGLDVLAWSLVHGFSALVVEGLLPVEAGTDLIRLFGRLVLSDPAVHHLDRAIPGPESAQTPRSGTGVPASAPG